MLKVQLERYLEMVCGKDYKPTDDAWNFARSAVQCGSVFPVELFIAWLSQDREAQAILDSLGVSWEAPTTNPEANVPLLRPDSGSGSPWEAQSSVEIGSFNFGGLGIVNVRESGETYGEFHIVQAFAGWLTVAPVNQKPGSPAVEMVRLSRLHDVDQSRIKPILETLPQWSSVIESEEDIQQLYPEQS